MDGARGLINMYVLSVKLLDHNFSSPVQKSKFYAMLYVMSVCSNPNGQKAPKEGGTLPIISQSRSVASVWIVAK